MIIEFPPRPHSNTQMHHSMTPAYILYYANLALVNVVSAGSSFITIKLNAFESVVFTWGNFISVNMFVLQNGLSVKARTGSAVAQW